MYHGGLFTLTLASFCQLPGCPSTKKGWWKCGVDSSEFFSPFGACKVKRTTRSVAQSLQLKGLQTVAETYTVTRCLLTAAVGTPAHQTVPWQSRWSCFHTAPWKREDNSRCACEATETHSCERLSPLPTPVVSGVSWSISFPGQPYPSSLPVGQQCTGAGETGCVGAKGKLAPSCFTAGQPSLINNPQ